MVSRASIAGHPIHPMLVPIPIGLFVFSLVADIAVYLGWVGAWPAVALYCIGGGIVGALLAAVFGLVDLLSVRDERVKKIGVAHMVINLIVVTLYIVNFWLRYQGEPLQGITGMLSVIAVAMLVASGWLGGHMVYIYGVAVAGALGRPLIDRRKAQMPVRQERRRTHGQPVGQH
ncbi:MAG: rane protein [Burkholderiales bacterium]|jgi:uncharacterized membrane protein|nr:rane protein [Burkholderiales bacterium]HJQ62142.1 DUF2231 domain-containing protein [Burkholderiales bacterium]